ncbi:MAG TPA: hypothetical protein PLN22_16520, partial [Ignavibacteria bacterium]|nr:hypothetical protein [Ignavibacteria bacterium]
MKQEIKGDYNIQAGGNIVIAQDIPAQIDYAKKLLNEFNPDSALHYLENLKARIWNTAIVTSIDKNRIITLIGHSKFAMNLHKEAASLYIEAYQYNRNDEIAKINFALGNFILGELNVVKATCEDILSINPQCVDAYAFQIDMLSNDKSIEEALLPIPKNLQEDPAILFGLGMFYMRKGNSLEAIELIEQSIHDKPEKLEYKAILANIFLTEAQKKELIVGYEEYKKDKSERALSLYNDVIDKIQNKELEKYRSSWYTNRGTAKGYLLDENGSIEDLLRSIHFDPKDTVAIHNLAMAYKGNNQIGKAIDLLENEDIPDFDFRNILLGEFYRFSKNYVKAKERYRYVIDSVKDPKLIYEARRLLVIALQQNGENEEARKINEELQKQNKDDIILLVNQSKFYLENGDEINAINALKHAYAVVNEETNLRYIKILANALYDFKLYEEASILLRKISNIDSNSPTFDSNNKDLLNAYIKLHQYDKALEICSILRPLIPENDQLAEIETHIHERTGNLEAAYKAYTEYFRYRNDDWEMLVRFAGLNLRMGNLVELDSFLHSEIDHSKLNIEASKYLAQLYDLRNIQSKFLDLSYEMRRRFYDESQIHSTFIALMMQAGEKYLYLQDIKNVGLDTVVFLKNGKITKHYIIEDRTDSDISKKEINVSTEIGRKLINKVIGDIVELTNNPLLNEQWEIVEIKSKYLFALEESMAVFNEFFPEDRSVLRITFDPNEGIKPMLEKIFSERNNYLESEILMKDLYKRGNLTVGI